MTTNANELTNVATQLVERLLTTKDASSILGLAPSTLDTYRNKGNGPDYIKLNDRAIRYALSSVLDYAYQSAVTTEASTSVINNSFLSVFLDNPKLQDEVRLILNKIDDIKTILNGLSASDSFKNNMSKLKFGFDKLTLNFELTPEKGEALQTALIKKLPTDLVKEERRNKIYKYVYRVFVNKAQETGITVLFNDTERAFSYSVQIQITPSKFDNKKKCKTLKKMLTHLLGTGYKQLLLNAYVSRFDICIDGEGDYVDSLIFNRKGARKRTITRSAKRNKPIYIKIGAKRSGYIIKIYYKDKEGITRIEFEFFPKPKSTKLKDVFTYDMKFSRFELYSPSFLFNSGIHPFTIYAIGELGIKKALGKLEDKQEQRYMKKVLKEHTICTDSEFLVASSHKKMKPFLGVLFGRNNFKF